MRKILVVILPVLVITLVFSIWLFFNSQVNAQENNAFIRLNAHDVLAIIAHPLPDGSNKGYYLPNARHQQCKPDRSELLISNIVIFRLKWVIFA